LVKLPGEPPLQGSGLTAGIAALIAFGWPTYARLIRGDILSVRTRDFTLAARAIGAEDKRILLRHILPNAIFPTLVYASMDIGSYVLSFAALSFLGLGADDQLRPQLDLQPGDLPAHRPLPGNGHPAVRAGLESDRGRVPRHYRPAA
jgi:hypothetical protein